MKTEIEKFIERRFPTDCNWLTGNCYYFALILKRRFPSGTIMYDFIDGHFLFEYEDMFFDFSGRIYPNIDNIAKWDIFIKTDPYRAERVRRDCMM